MAAIATAVEIKRFETSAKTNGIIFDELRHDLADWLEAKEDLVYPQAFELTQTTGEFVVDVLIKGVEPGDMKVLVAPDIVLIEGETHAGRKLFRPVKFPRTIDPRKVRVDFKDGVLSVRAGIARAAAAMSPMLLAA